MSKEATDIEQCIDVLISFPTHPLRVSDGIKISSNRIVWLFTVRNDNDTNAAASGTN